LLALTDNRCNGGPGKDVSGTSVEIIEGSIDGEIEKAEIKTILDQDFLPEWNKT
jgi:hypothetical protein